MAADRPDFGFRSDVWPGVAKVIEECGEVTQVLGKLIMTGGDVAHWDGTDLKDRLMEELADLMAAITFVVDFNDLDQDWIIDRAEAKYQKFKGWRESR